MIGLLSCSNRKLAVPARARDLYCSPLFRKSLAYAEPRCTAVYVLSAAHGLVTLDEEVEPYDLELASLTPRECEKWGARVVDQLLAHEHPAPLLILAGTVYSEPVLDALRFVEDHAWRAVVGTPASLVMPLAGMSIGARLHFLTDCASARV